MVHRWCRRACGGATARARGRGGVDGGLRPGGGGAGAAQRGAGLVSDAGDGVRGGAGDGVCGSDARGRVRERSATCPDRRVSSERAGVSEHDPPIAKKSDPHKAPTTVPPASYTAAPAAANERCSAMPPTAASIVNWRPRRPRPRHRDAGPTDRVRPPDRNALAS